MIDICTANKETYDVVQAMYWKRQGELELIRQCRSEHTKTNRKLVSTHQKYYLSVVVVAFHLHNHLKNDAE